jgi:hypothetical protein
MAGSMRGYSDLPLLAHLREKPPLLGVVELPEAPAGTKCVKA